LSDNHYHTVAKDENLSTIAKKYGINTGKIITFNPSLRKNPNLIRPGMSIKISNKISSTDTRISKISFNAKEVIVYSSNNNRILAKFPAISGLPSHAPHLKDLIKKENRKDLKIDTDYTNTEFQNVKDAGPIPEDTYILPLKTGMPYDKSRAQGSGDGWGEGGWRLKENFWAKVDNYFGGRSGFFLHHDGGSRGTSGCIGLKNSGDMKKLRNIISKAQKQGQKQIPIEVKYKKDEIKKK